MAPKLSGRESKMSMRMRIFRRRGSEDTYEESASEADEHNGQSEAEHPERMSSLGAMTSFGPPPPGLFGPTPYINPRGHKLEARVEVSTLPKHTRRLDHLRGPRAQRPIAPEPQTQEPDLQTPELQAPEQPATASTCSSPTLPDMAALPTKAQKHERREQHRRKNRDHRERSRSRRRGSSQKRGGSRENSRSNKNERTHPNLVVIPDNRGGVGLTANLPDTPPSDGEPKSTSANNLSQLDDHISDLNDRLTQIQLQDLSRDLTRKLKNKKMKKPYQGYNLINCNDIPNDDESDDQSDHESEGGESVGSIDTVGPQTYHLGVKDNVVAIAGQLVDQDLAKVQADKERTEFIYLIANGAAKAKCDVEAWVKYLDSYSSGHFVASKPPSPPPYHANFGYLPAVKSPNDQERHEANRMFRPIWDRWSAFKPKFTLLVLRILEMFDVAGVAVSLFDEEDEIIAVERGLGIGSFPRAHSLAAHALAGEDHLIVPDTHEDWRFAENPLVVGPTNIRFFAATPLLTHNAHAIAILSIFDSEPRMMFSPRQRREFTEFADRLLTNLTNQVLFMTSAVVRNHPEMQNDAWCLDELASRPGTPSESKTRAPIYPPLQLIPKTPTTSPTHSFGGSFRSPGPPQVPLPPLPVSQPGSAASGSLSSRNMGSSHHHQAAYPNHRFGAVPDDVVTPDSGNYPAEARPWSSSDLTSIRHAPPNTPKNRGSKLRPFEFTVEDSYALSDEDVQEECEDNEEYDEDGQEFEIAHDGTYSEECQHYSYHTSSRFPPSSQDTDLYDASPALSSFPDFDSGRIHTSQSSGSIQSAFKLDEETESVVDQSVSDESVLSYCSIPLLQRDSSIMRKYKSDRKAEKEAALANLADDVSYRQSVSTDSVRSYSSIPLMERSDADLARKFKGKGREVDRGDEMPPPKIMATEADQICYDSMRTMEYDIIYAVEIIGASNHMSNEALAVPGALKLRILATSQTINLVDEKDSFVHLEALRSRGCFGVPGTLLLNTTLRGHQYGLMAGIQTVSGPLRTKTCGIVVAAFRRMNTMINGEEENDFMAVVEKLKGLLTTPTKGTFKSRIPRIPSTICR